MNYYEHHLGDWAAATGHLSWDEDMAYTRLLRAYYHAERAIPEGQQYRLAKAATPAQRKAVDAVLAEFFVLVDGHHHQKRADEEIARYQDKARKAKASANARWSQSERNANASPNAMRTHSDGNALQSPVSRLQAPDSRTEPSLRSGSGAREPFDSWEFVDSQIRPVYPPGTYPDAQWLIASKAIERIIETRLDTPAGLVAKVTAYRAQCDGLERTGTQFVTNPAKHFDPGGGAWRGPFPLPKKPETPMERLYRLNGGQDRQAIDGEVVNG